ncbi:protein of unknown function [Modestobacter italicus]|uniref:Uncharacterized protein n=1 Tax=Modestobacter italicus (strain DSM 44449 / CECT 9708 / BC 501) TaxID=2732864 RepID=I4ERZ2_MODI5|nr:hypothetical protein [Modestobacter marinus]CCH86155.1 protein of unknown function [Modestobacter marinus]
MTDGGGIEETLEHYLRVALRSPEDGSRAVSLAVANVHVPVQRALAELGQVAVQTEEDIGDISCVYEVSGPGPQGAVVFISTVLPYAAVILRQDGRYLRFATAADSGWPGSVVQCLTDRGVFVLSEAVCRSKRPNASWHGGPTHSYFEDLFEDEFGPPEDWFWVEGSEPAENGRDGR